MSIPEASPKHLRERGSVSVNDLGLSGWMVSIAEGMGKRI